MDTSETVTLTLANKQVSQPLPSLCVCCGKFTTVTKPWTFRWRPEAYILTDFIPYSGGGIGYREAKMEAPVCEEHARVLARTRSMRLGIRIGMFAVLGLWLASVLFVGDLSFLPMWIRWAFLIGPVALLYLALLAVNSYGRALSAKAVHIDETTLTLAGVSDQFSDALMQLQQ
jgi:hypothetical protein